MQTLAAMADLEGVVRGWAAAYTEEVAEFAPCEVVSDSQVCACACTCTCTCTCTWPRCSGRCTTR